MSLSFGWQRAPSQLVLAGVYGGLGACLRRGADGLVIPDRTLGLLRSGLMSEDYLLWICRRLPPGLTEVYLHPSADPAAEPGEAPTATHRSAAELRALTSRRVAEAVERGRIRLVGAEDFRAGPA